METFVITRNFKILNNREIEDRFILSYKLKQKKHGEILLLLLLPKTVTLKNLWSFFINKKSII